MIDLRNKGLPKTVEVCGSPFFIHTDFRDWLKFGELIKSGNCTLEDLEFLFVDKVPLVDFSKPLMNFYLNENSTPRNEGSEGREPIIDYIQDGEYIVGSFMSEYGIDLTEVNMHWHLFKALFLSLPDDSKIKRIMSFRAYEKSDKKEETVRNDLKRIWRLPRNDENESELIAEINDEFYNC